MDVQAILGRKQLKLAWFRMAWSGALLAMLVSVAVEVGSRVRRWWLPWRRRNAGRGLDEHEPRRRRQLRSRLL